MVRQSPPSRPAVQRLLSALVFALLLSIAWFALPTLARGAPDTPPGPPSPSQPANGSTLNTIAPMLAVTTNLAAGVAHSMEVQLATNSAFNQNVRTLTRCNTLSAAEQYWLSENLIPGKLYYWHARIAYGNACSGTPAWSAWSSAWTFTTASGGSVPVPPQLTGPANARPVIVNPPTFKWNASPAAADFALGVNAVDGTAAYGFFGTSVPSIIYTPTSALEPGRGYTWHTRLRTTYGWGDWSPLRSFTLTAGVPATLERWTAGTMMFTDAQKSVIKLEVPAALVTTTTQFVYAVITPTLPAVPGSGYAHYGFALDFYRNGIPVAPPGAVMAKPIRVTFTYTDRMLHMLSEDSLALMLWDGHGWVDAPAACSPAGGYIRQPEDNRLIMTICHQGDYAFRAGMMALADREYFPFGALRAGS